MSELLFYLLISLQVKVHECFLTSTPLYSVVIFLESTDRRPYAISDEG